MKTPGPPASSKLPQAIHHQLNAYALVASAAGVGVLALARSAQAKIVYTPANKSITPNTTLPLDLNHDGRKDFKFQDPFGPTSAGEWSKGYLSVLPVRPANEIEGNAGRFHFASALASGVQIGAGNAFSQGGKVMAYGGFDAGTSGTPYCAGPWYNATNRYLGLKFTIRGKAHFGWARLSITCDQRTGAPSAVLSGYAYETIPNKSIIAGKTKEAEDAHLGRSSLGHLAKSPARVPKFRQE